MSQSVLRGFVTTKQIIPRPGEFSDSEGSACGEGSADRTQTTGSYTASRRVRMTEKESPTPEGSFPNLPRMLVGETHQGQK